MDEEISPAASLEVGNTLLAEAIDGLGLGALGNLESLVSPSSSGTSTSVPKAASVNPILDTVMEIIPDPLEALVFLDPDLDIHVASGSIPLPRPALARQSEPVPVSTPSGTSTVRLRSPMCALTRAHGAGMVDPLPVPEQSGQSVTVIIAPEQCLACGLHPCPAVARRTHDRIVSGSAPDTVAVVAPNPGSKRPRVQPERRLGEVEVQPHGDVATALGAASAAHRNH